jgi:uncharacterized membrane protein YjgN (DUF898 family)
MRSFEEEIKEMERSKKTGQMREIREIKEEVVDKPPVAQGPAELGIRFVGSGSEYFRIWIVNLLLTLVTLGFYYPFAKTRRLKYFYGATEVGGHPLSFHGTPWGMFRGYVLAALLLIAYSVARYFSPVAEVAAVAVLILLWPVLWHSSLRFRLANTGWRGLRMRFTGTRAGAYKALLLPGVLVLVLFAIFAATGQTPIQQLEDRVLFHALWVTYVALFVLMPPYGLWLVKRYQNGHLALADERSAFDVGLGKFFGLYGMTFLLGLLMGGVFVVLAFMGGGIFSALPRWMIVALPFVAYLLALCIVGGYFAAHLQNLVWNGTRSKNLALRSTLPSGALIQLWFKNWLLTLVTVGFYHPYAKVASARLRLESVTLLATVNVDELVAAQGANAATATGDAAGELFGLDFSL